MLYLIIKYLITAGVIVAVSEIAKTSDKLGALIISLPIMTILTLLWLYIEWVSTEKLSNHMYYTFWYVLPTLPMFLAFPYMMARWGFWIAFGASIIMTMVIFLLYALVMKEFGIYLI